MTMRRVVAAAAFAFLAPPAFAAQYTLDDLPLPAPDGYQPLVWEFVVNDFTLDDGGSFQVWDAVFDPFVPVTTELGRRNGLEIVFRAPEGKAFVIDEEVSKSGLVGALMSLLMKRDNALKVFQNDTEWYFLPGSRGFGTTETLPVTFRLDGSDGPVETTSTQPAPITGAYCEILNHPCVGYSYVYGFEGVLYNVIPQQSGVFSSMRFIIDTNASQDRSLSDMYVANATNFLEDPSDVRFQLVNLFPSGTATAPLISIAPLPTAVPIPATGPLALAGLALLGILARRRKPA